MADPGITFETYSPKGEGRSPQRHYRCDPFKELAKIPVADFAAENCFVFLCIPPRSVFATEPLMRAWGFKFTGKAFCWAKQNKNWTKSKKPKNGSWATATAPVTTVKIVGSPAADRNGVNRRACAN